MFYPKYSFNCWGYFFKTRSALFLEMPNPQRLLPTCSLYPPSVMRRWSSDCVIKVGKLSILKCVSLFKKHMELVCTHTKKKLPQFDQERRISTSWAGVACCLVSCEMRPQCISMFSPTHLYAHWFLRSSLRLLYGHSGLVKKRKSN